jgi:hypothetical protein
MIPNSVIVLIPAVTLVASSGISHMQRPGRSPPKPRRTAWERKHQQPIPTNKYREMRERVQRLLRDHKPERDTLLKAALRH